MEKEKTAEEFVINAYYREKEKTKHAIKNRNFVLDEVKSLLNLIGKCSKCSIDYDIHADRNRIIMVFENEGSELEKEAHDNPNFDRNAMMNNLKNTIDGIIKEIDEMSQIELEEEDKR